MSLPVEGQCLDFAGHIVTVVATQLHYGRDYVQELVVTRLGFLAALCNPWVAW
jgi:hypothetical protein